MRPLVRSSPIRAVRTSRGVALVLAFVRLPLDCRGATAVEFALLSPFVILTIFFMISIGYMLLMNQCLDFATQKAARQLRTGAIQTAGLTQSNFQKTVVCPLLPPLFNCADVIVNIQAVPIDATYPNEYYVFVNAARTGLIIPPLSNNQTSYCPGQAQKYVYIQILYPVSFFISLLSSSSIATMYNGQPKYLIMATATMLNEPFNAPVSPC